MFTDRSMRTDHASQIIDHRLRSQSHSFPESCTVRSDLDDVGHGACASLIGALLRLEDLMAGLARQSQFLPNFRCRTVGQVSNGQPRDPVDDDKWSVRLPRVDPWPLRN